jgi:hypothetical protein
MPQMADIVVKKNDGVTNVTYTAVVPSAGDKSAALWRNQSVGTAPAHRPTLVVSSRPNGTGTARRLDYEFTYPSLVVGTDGKTTVADKFVVTCSLLVPNGMADADINEAAAQSANLMASTLLVSSVKAGYSPT